MNAAARTRTLEFSDSFKALVDQGRFDEAEAFLESFEAQDAAERRMKEHFRGQMLLYRGRNDEARQYLERVRRTHGSHLRLVCDLVTLHYFLGDFLLWKNTADELRKLFAQLRERVCEDTYYRVGVLLAKTEEELGRLGEALSIYQELRERFPEPHEPLRHLKCLIQEIRIRSMLGLVRGLGAPYERLLTLSERESNQSLYIESQHALMLADSFLVSPLAGLNRLRKMLSRDDLRETDRRLFYFDMIDAFLVSGASSEDLRSLESFSAEPGDALEAELAKLLHDRPRFDPLGLSEEIPLAGHLRLLSLHARLFPKFEAQASRRKFYLLLEGLDRESRALWSARVEGHAESTTDTFEVVLNVLEQAIEYNGKRISLQRRRALWDLLVVLQRHPSIDLDQLTRSLWQTESNPSYFHRIRMTAKRLNELFLELCAHPDAISVTQTGASLTPHIRLISQN